MGYFFIGTRAFSHKFLIKGLYHIVPNCREFLIRYSYIRYWKIIFLKKKHDSRSMHTNMRIEPASLELSGLLAERASLTAAVNKAIVARALVKKVLAPHLWSVEARVHALAPNQAVYQRVQGSARSASFKKYRIHMNPCTENNLFDQVQRLTGWAFVDDLGDTAEGDAGAETSHATCKLHATDPSHLIRWCNSSSV